MLKSELGKYSCANGVQAEEEAAKNKTRINEVNNWDITKSEVNASKGHSVFEFAIKKIATDPGIFKNGLIMKGNRGIIQMRKSLWEIIWRKTLRSCC